MSYGSRRISTLLIPDKSKPTATWGRKAMGLSAATSKSAVIGCQVTEGVIDELVKHLAFALEASARAAPPHAPPVS